jgi:hypothetical protein
MRGAGADRTDNLNTALKTRDSKAFDWLNHQFIMIMIQYEKYEAVSGILNQSSKQTGALIGRGLNKSD